MLRALVAARPAAGQAAQDTPPTSVALGDRELWVLVHGDAAAAAELRRLGATIAARASSGSPYVARLAAMALEQLAAVPGVSYIEASRSYRPVVDVSVPATGAMKAWELSDPSSQSLTGHDVLIAVVDTGADWSHPDLRNADGTTRIRHLLDQTCDVEGYEPCTMGTDTMAGREWDTDDINGWLTAGQLPGEVVDTDTGARLPDDTFPGAACDFAAGCGHGTHVASVAAGTGYSTELRTFRGVAPDADLLIVRSDLETASILQAWRWIVEKAAVLGKPVVIVNAFGADDGPHDGTSTLERELNWLSGPGVIFVVAAGNAGDGRKHASGEVADGAPSKFAFQLTEEGEGSFSLWYPATEQWEFVLSKSGGGEQARVSPGETATVEDVPDGSATTTIMVIATDAPHAVHTELNRLSLTVSRPSGGASGAWIGELHRVSGSGPQRWDAWVTDGEVEFYKAGIGGTTGGVDTSRTLTEPATAKRAITVAAYTTRLTWPCSALPIATPTLAPGVTPAATATPSCTQNLISDSTPTPVSGGVAHFSSRGPTRNRQEKPDLAAPGEPIIGARAHLVPAPDPAPYASEHQVMRQGTSLAAAHVAGAITLLLQVNPLLSPEEAAALLRSTAQRDEYTDMDMGTATPWSAPWGAGKLQVLSAAQTVIATTPTVTPFPDLTATAQANATATVWANLIATATANAANATATATPTPTPTSTTTATATATATATITPTGTPRPPTATPKPAPTSASPPRTGGGPAPAPRPPAVLVGELRWDHRASPPHLSYRTAVTVRFYPAGRDPASRSAQFTVTTETDARGRFSVSLGDVSDETFDVNVKPAGGLSREQRDVRLRRASSRIVHFGAVSDGDLDGNDRIDAQDAAAFRSHFGRFAGEDGYTVTADFDRDGRITVLDWSHIARRQGQQGPEPVS